MTEQNRSTTKWLPCELTKSELLAYGSELGTVTQDIKTEEDRHTSIKQELKATITQLESQRTILASKITRKEEHRDIEVDCKLDFGRDLYVETRTDTGEEILTRPIRDDERQEAMEFKTGTDEARDIKAIAADDSAFMQACNLAKSSSALAVDFLRDRLGGISFDRAVKILSLLAEVGIVKEVNDNVWTVIKNPDEIAALFTEEVTA